MSYRSILTHVQSSPAAEPRLAGAIALARSFEATLIGLGAESIVPIGIGDPMGVVDAEWIKAMREVVEIDLADCRQLFERRAQGLATVWRRAVLPPSLALCALARGADLIVAGGGPRGEDSFHAAPIGELVVTCGRPVLVAPPAAAPLEGKAAVVAWKDTREARRALYDSLPLLKRAKQVLVVEVTSPDDLENAQARTSDVVESLARHGIPARARTACADETSVVGEIEAHAAAIGADLIVAGGYGHARLREWVLGGVTRGLLKETDRYVLFSH